MPSQSNRSTSCKCFRLRVVGKRRVLFSFGGEGLQDTWSGNSESSTSRQDHHCGRVTAELSFGFGVTCCCRNTRSPCGPHSPHFPHLPAQVGRQELESRCERVRGLRNRISHHEPLLNRDISKDYSQALELLRWMSPEKAEWVKPRLETMQIPRRRP